MENDFNPYPITTYYIFQECFKKAGLINNGIFIKKKWALELRSILMDYVINYVNKNLTKLSDLEKNGHIQKILGYPGSEENYKGYEGYLRDNFNEVVKILNKKNNSEELTFNKEKFWPLLQYAGIENYRIINNSFDNRNSEPKFYIDRVIYKENKAGHEIEIPLLNYENLNPDWVTGGMIEFVGERTNPNLVAKPSEIENALIAEKRGLIVEDELPEVTIDPVIIPAVAFKRPVPWFDPLPIPDEGELMFYKNGDCEYIGGYSLFIKSGAITFAGTFAMKRDQGPRWVKIIFTNNKKSQTLYFAIPQPDAEALVLGDPARLLTLFKNQAAQAATAAAQ